MAYATLLSLENTINQTMNHDRCSISPDEEKQIISLDKYVIFFQAFLEDFPEKAKILEARIRDVAAEAEDILEWFLWKQIRNSYRYIKRISVLRRIKFKEQLQKVRDEMDSVAAEVVEIQNSIIIKDKHFGDYVGASSSSQVADTGKNNVVGFNEDLIKIKEGLCGWARQLQVLAIFGMGGIGKTTLVRNAYDDQLIMEHFQIRVWVTISQDYSERRILLDILDSMKEFDSESEGGKESSASNSKMAQRSEMTIGEMALKVHKILISRRYLIVIDDIWSTKVLDDVKKLFPNDNNGSRIMLTIRLKEVASHANSSTLSHEMRLMDKDQSWNLLQQKVFKHQDRVPPELVSIGREIARSCGGLPLAIVVIAGLLSTMNRTLTSWGELARNIRSALATTDGQIIEKILSLSYNHLPHNLRPCFLYLGVFPEDHEIKVAELMRLWIAESFVKPVVSKRFEDTAEEYLKDLVDRSLIMVTKRKSNGKIKCCSLHDMVREMSIKLSEEEKFCIYIKGIIAPELIKSMKDQRRITIFHIDQFSLTNIHSLTIRTIISFKHELSFSGSFILLRVLDLLRAHSQSDSFSDEFSKLYHLRYLAFCNSKSIPTAISNLQSLQTLVVKDINDSCLPCDIWKMQQLRHLIISNTRLPEDTNAPTLENLQTLRMRNLTCSIRMINLIQNITKLQVTYSFGSGELFFHNLVHLSQLEKLHLELGTGWISSGKSNLVAPSSLRKLTLIGWGNDEPHLDIVGPFPNLEVLKLKRFNFMLQEWRTIDEAFPQLEFLLIEETNLRDWVIESSHFSRLKTLMFRSCRDLCEIPECIGEIPTLGLIEIKLCMDSLVESAKRIQEEVQANGDDAFQVLCIGGKPMEFGTSDMIEWIFKTLLEEEIVPDSARVQFLFDNMMALKQMYC